MSSHRKKAKMKLFLLLIRSIFALGLWCEVIVPTCHIESIGNFNKVWWVEFLSYIATHIHNSAGELLNLSKTSARTVGLAPWLAWVIELIWLPFI
jgi:hypothetical protein